MENVIDTGNYLMSVVIAESPISLQFRGYVSDIDQEFVLIQAHPSKRNCSPMPLGRRLITQLPKPRMWKFTISAHSDINNFQ